MALSRLTAHEKGFLQELLDMERCSINEDITHNKIFGINNEANYHLLNLIESLENKLNV